MQNKNLKLTKKYWTKEEQDVVAESHFWSFEKSFAFFGDNTEKVILRVWLIHVRKKRLQLCTCCCCREDRRLSFICFFFCRKCPMSSRGPVALQARINSAYKNNLIARSQKGKIKGSNLYNKRSYILPFEGLLRTSLLDFCSLFARAIPLACGRSSSKAVKLQSD